MGVPMGMGMGTNMNMNSGPGRLLATSYLPDIDNAGLSTDYNFQRLRAIEMYGMEYQGPSGQNKGCHRDTLPRSLAIGRARIHDNTRPGP